MLDEVLVAGGPTGIEIQPVVMVRGPDEFERALTTMVKERVRAPAAKLVRSSRCKSGPSKG
jgi:hypothetical protein